jgi:hypothetical protein
VLACHVECIGFSFKDSTLNEYALNMNENIYREQNIVIKGRLWVIL